MPSASLPDPEIIRRTAEEVIRRPAFRLDAQPESGEKFLNYLLQFLDWIFTPFRWLAELLSGLPFWLRWPIFIALTALVVALVLHIICTLVMAIRRPVRSAGLATLDARTRDDPEAIERQAAEAVARGDYIAAIRLLFRASLLRLDRAEKRQTRVGTTNREYLQRHRESPVFEHLKLFVETIDSRWYGRETCRPEDYEVCLAAHARIRQLAKDVLRAHSA